MNNTLNYRTIAEYAFVKEMITKTFPKGIVSLVGDSFDLWSVITEILPRLKEQILSRDGKLVIRPDSGDPVDIICGHHLLFEINDTENIQFGNDLHIPHIGEDPSGMSEDGMMDWSIESLLTAIEETVGIIHNEGKYYCKINGQFYSFEFILHKEDDGASLINVKLISESEIKGVIELLWDIFGGTVNEQGYKVLDSHIGCIYGDSITIDRQVQIYERLAAKGFAATNIVLGVGSFTYQYNTRDTFGFAAKGAWFEVENEDGTKTEYSIYKDPVTDDGTKKSLKGLQMVYEELGGEIAVKSECNWEQENKSLLQTIYENGEFRNQTSLTEIKSRIDELVK